MDGTDGADLEMDGDPQTPTAPALCDFRSSIHNLLAFAKNCCIISLSDHDSIEIIAPLRALPVLTCLRLSPRSLSFPRNDISCRVLRHRGSPRLRSRT